MAWQNSTTISLIELLWVPVCHVCGQVSNFSSGMLLDILVSQCSMRGWNTPIISTNMFRVILKWSSHSSSLHIEVIKFSHQSCCVESSNTKKVSRFQQGDSNLSTFWQVKGKSGLGSDEIISMCMVYPYSWSCINQGKEGIVDSQPLWPMSWKLHSQASAWLASILVHFGSSSALHLKFVLNYPSLGREIWLLTPLIEQLCAILILVS